MTQQTYLAGPMRNIPQFNHPAFNEATIVLRALGFSVFSPAEHDIEIGLDVREMNGKESAEELAKHNSFSLRAALGADLDFIAHKADNLVILPNWTKSKGVAAEIATAEALSIPMYLYNGLDTFLSGSSYSRASLLRKARKNTVKSIAKHSVVKI